MIENNIEELLHIYDETLYTTSGADNNAPASKGGFEKKVMIITQPNGLDANTEILLNKMLTACNLSVADYSIVSIDVNAVLDTINQLQPETILLFDLAIHSPAFVLHKDKYKPFRFAGKKMLLCDSLHSISNNPALKSALWVSGLKPLFNIA